MGFLFLKGNIVDMIFLIPQFSLYPVMNLQGVLAETEKG
jgi:hypothetical protein